jgi:hypothetical protein
MVQAPQKLTMYTPAIFRVRVQGVLDKDWGNYFDTQAVSIEKDTAGFLTTVLTSKPVDQSALVGLVNYLNSLGLPLISIECLNQ